MSENPNSSEYKEDLIKKFYSSFSAGKVNDMLQCYHPEVTFQDPAFGILKGDRAHNMWRMLLSQQTDQTKISFSNIKATKEYCKAEWKAEYVFGPKKRAVVNLVQAQFKFKEDKIIEHIDTFDLWKWSKQALGASGYLLGWTPFMKSKIQKMTKQKLDTFIDQNNTK